MPAASAQERLGDLLRRCRSAADLGQVALAELLDTDQGTVSRIEHGRVLRPGRQRVEAWLRHTQANEESAALAFELVDQADTTITATASNLADGWEAHQARYDELERSAGLIRIYQCSQIPALFQSPDYMDVLLRRVVKVPPGQLSEALAARMRRQDVLYLPRTRVSAVLAEHVLRARLGGSKVMASQLHRIAALATLPSVDLAVLPTGTDMDEVWNHAFVLFEGGAPEEAQVRIDLDEDEVVLTTPARVKYYQELHDFYRAHALAGQDAIDLVQQIAKEVTD